MTQYANISMITILRGKRHNREVYLKSQLSRGLILSLEIKVSTNPKAWAN